MKPTTLALAAILMMTGVALFAVQADRRTAPATGQAILLPGLEERAMSALAPLFRALAAAGRSAGDVKLNRDVVEVSVPSASGVDSVACPFAGNERIEVTHLRSASADLKVPHATEARRGLLVLRFCTCGVSLSEGHDGLLAELEASGTPPLWEAESTPAIVAFGVLSPVAESLGMTPKHVMDWSFFIGLTLLGAIVWSSRVTPEQLRDCSEVRGHLWPRLVALALAAAGLAARAWFAVRSAADSDEQWAMPGPTPIFADTHDAWVHPPFGRAVAYLWGRSIHWNADSGQILLRLLPLLLSAVALGLLANLAYRRASWAAVCATAVVAFSAQAIEAGMLARPYALVGLAWACLVCATASSRASPTAIATAGIACMTCAWTDVMAGGVALAWFGIWLWSRSSPARALAALGASAAAVVSLVPGALVASSHHVNEGPGEADLTLRAGQFGRVAGELLQSMGPPFFPEVVGALVILVTVAYAWRRRARIEALFVGVVVAAMLALVSALALRPRNVAFFAWVLCAVWLARPREAGADEREQRG